MIKRWRKWKIWRSKAVCDSILRLIVDKNVSAKRKTKLSVSIADENVEMSLWIQREKSEKCSCHKISRIGAHFLLVYALFCVLITFFPIIIFQMTRQNPNVNRFDGEWFVDEAGKSLIFRQILQAKTNQQRSILTEKTCTRHISEVIARKNYSWCATSGHGHLKFCFQSVGDFIQTPPQWHMTELEHSTSEESPHVFWEKPFTM